MKATIQFHRRLKALAAGSAILIVALASANRASAQLNNTSSGPFADHVNGASAGAGMTTGDENSAYGFSALQLTNAGSRNTAVGSGALQTNTVGNNSTAIGYGALTVNIVGNNTALGSWALNKNTTGTSNTASGLHALSSNTLGSFNTATGREALYLNLDGASNVAVGYQALYKNTTGDFNVAIGDGALQNTIGDGNIGIGEDGGFNLTTGSNNIYIGNPGGVPGGGTATESGIIRIGLTKTATAGFHTDTYLAGIIHGNGSGLTGITGASLAANSVSTTKIAAGAVTSAKLAANLTLGGDTTLSGNAAVSGGSSVAGNLFVDSAGANTGAIGGSPGLVFGLSNSGEGIASKRTEGGNQFGLDFYTGFVPRLSISNAGDTIVGGNLLVSGPNARVGINNGLGTAALTLRGRGFDINILDVLSAGGTEVFFVSNAGDTTIKGNATVGGTLGVTGNTTLSTLGVTGTFGVTGNSTLTGNLRVGGTASRFNVNTGGFSNVTSVIRAAAGHATTLDVQDSAGSPVFLTGSSGTTITGNSTVSGNSTVTGTLFANGSTSATLVAPTAFFSSSNQVGFLSFSSIDFTSAISIRAQNGIRASDFFASSDRRIKNIVGQSATRKDLETIERLKVTDYRMKDRVAKGDQLHKGFIAQEVQAVIPEAVTRGREFIPSVYAVAAELAYDQAAQTVKVGMAKAHELKKGDKVRLISDDGTVEKEVVDVPDEKTFVVQDIAQEPKRLFVYGREVDDFLAVDYNRIFTTAVGATQELAKEVASLQTRAGQLEASEEKARARAAALEGQVAGLQQKDAEIAALKAENKSLAQKFAALEARDQARVALDAELQARLTRLEHALDNRPAPARAVNTVLDLK